MMFIDNLKSVLSLLAITIISLLLVSCGQDSETDLDMQGEAGLMLIHSAPNIGDFRLFIDSGAINNAISYGVNTPYLVSKVGRRKATLKLSSSDEEIISQDVFFSPQRYYSYFIAEKRPEEEKHSYVAVADIFPILRTGRIRLRFINMVPDTLRLDLRTQFSTDTVSRSTFSNAAFKSVSAFQELNAGTYTFEALKAGSLTDIVVGTQTVTFEEKKHYTIWVGGLMGGQGAKAIRSYIIQNN